jgi:uncharacterized protein
MNQRKPSWLSFEEIIQEICCTNDLNRLTNLIRNKTLDNKSISRALVIASRAGSIPVAQILIESGADINYCYGALGGTPLTEAVEKGHIDIVKILLKVGADTSIPKYGEISHPLAVAAYEGNLEMVKLLVESGADVNQIHKENKVSAIDAAAGYGHEEVYKYLYPLTNNELREGTEEFLLLAIREKYIEELADPDIIKLNKVISENELCEVETIINSEININAHDSFGNTPLIEACVKTNPIIVKKLLAAGANPNIKNYDNETPLMRVVGEFPYRVEVCRKLIQAGADINAQDNDGKTALMNAANIGSRSCVKLLLDMGAIKTIQDNDGRIALDYASSHSQEDYFWAVNVDYPTVINLLEQ